MAHFDAPRPAPIGAVSIFRAVNFLDSLYRRFAAWLIARETEKSLRKLTDRELDDIGLSRGTISELADKMARYEA